MPGALNLLRNCTHTFPVPAGFDQAPHKPGISRGHALQAHPGMRIIIAGTENILWNMYNGSQKSMLITNCIFRWGGFAALLSNHPADRFRAKYKLQHVVRTHLGSKEDAYKCVLHRSSLLACSVRVHRPW